MTNPFTEDTLVQQTTADYLFNDLGWDESVYAFDEKFGENGTLGRYTEQEVVLVRYLRKKLEALNPNLPEEAYRDAVRKILESSSSQSILNTNRARDQVLRNGVEVIFRNEEGERNKKRLRIFDFEIPENNHFLIVRELWIKGDIYRRRADIIGYVNGIPLVFMEREGKLGVFWHTQGSGKSYSIVFFTKKVHRRLGGNYTFLVLTDREDLDSQIYKTLAGCGLADNDKDPCRVSSGTHLKSLLAEHKSVVFSLIQKFNQDVLPDEPYSNRDDIIVITDEAHRTQYGDLSLNMRTALPNASFIGFTGTPLFSDDEITKRVFGDYVSTYDFQRAVEDGATVPLYYDARGQKLDVATNDLNEKIADKLEEFEVDDVNVEQHLERELKRDYHIITAGNRLDQIARDFVQHYSEGWENGKAMLVCIDKITCVRMHKLIDFYWQERIQELETESKNITDDQEMIFSLRQLDWMKETIIAVMISEEQGEVVYDNRFS